MKSTELIQPLAMAQPIANSGTRNLIPETTTTQGLASISSGFPDETMVSPDNGGLPPRGQDCNGMFYLSTDQRVYQQNGGIITFNQAVSDAIGGYPKNAILDYIDENNTYFKVQSLIDDNTYNFIQDPSLLDNTNWKKVSFGGSGLEICDIGMSLYVDETKGLRRYLNGQIVAINTNTQAFLDKLKKITTLNPTLLCSEEEWQAAKTLSKFGQVGKFVFNYAADTTTVESVRLPAIVNIQGLLNLANLGLTVDESLPNLRGEQSLVVPDMGASTGVFSNDRQNANNGVYEDGSKILDAPAKGGTAGEKFYINANNYCSTYQDNAPVQQEAILYPYFIQIATEAETQATVINKIEALPDTILFEPKYSDTMLYDSGLVPANSSRSKILYPDAYNALLVEANPDITAGTTVNISDTFTYTKRAIAIKEANSSDITDYDWIIDKANETFTTPKKTQTGIINSNKNLYVTGNGKALGLTDGINNLSIAASSDTSGLRAATGFFDAAIGSYPQEGTQAVKKVIGVSQKPEKSGMIIDTSSISEGLYLYFRVANTAQNAAIANLGATLESLNKKADTSLSNITPQALKLVAAASMPSDKYIDLALGTTGSTYTAPADGWFAFRSDSRGAATESNRRYVYAYETGAIMGGGVEATLDGSEDISFLIPCLKGKVIEIYHNLPTALKAGEVRRLRFYYAQGAQHD